MWKILERSRIPVSRFIHCRSVTRQCNRTKNISEYIKEMEEFKGVYPNIIETLRMHPALSHSKQTMDWLEKIMAYNLKGGKKVRPKMALTTYQMLAEPDNITDESLHTMQVLGWCVEIVQTYFLIADDILDGSLFRRGQPAWHLVPEVGSQAVNDCSLLLGALYYIIKKNCIHLPAYGKIIHLFNDCLLYTSLGQHLDYTVERNDYRSYTFERYNNLVTYKTAYYTYTLPVFLGMYVADMPQSSYAIALQICLDLGFLFQMQDDIIDCYSSQEEKKKSGTDIQEGKCTWLAVYALSKATPAQRVIFRENYGRHNEECIEAIKSLYKVVDIPAAYQQEKAQYEKKILQNIQSLDTKSRALFTTLLDQVVSQRKNQHSTPPKVESS